MPVPRRCVPTGPVAWASERMDIGKLFPECILKAWPGLAERLAAMGACPGLAFPSDYKNVSEMDPYLGLFLPQKL